MTEPTWRLTASGQRLVDQEGRPVVLQGVNMYLEWYMHSYGAIDAGSSALDVPHMRKALPAANAIRFVALLWKDSIKESDGLECSTEDASSGYFDPECLRYVDALIRQATDAGLWVIIAARAKYAAGWGLGQPDVWGDATLRRKMLAMWRFIATRYAHTERIAGYEIMSEPRTKTISQGRVTGFMREGCEAVHSADPRALCVVGPRPYYKLWELSSQVLQPAGSNTLYTFDFFVPKKFVMSDSQKERERYCGGGRPDCLGSFFPAQYACKDVYDTWWHGQPGCHGASSMVRVDERWVRGTMERLAAGFARTHNVPVHVNQWGVKDEVFDDNGRLRYADAMLASFTEHAISSTYWIWRSYVKEGRDVDAPVWGFELVHNDGPHEALDGTMLAALQAGFVATATRNAGNVAPCGLAAARAPPVLTSTPADATRSAAALARRDATVHAPPELPADTLCECDADALEARIDWSLLAPRGAHVVTLGRDQAATPRGEPGLPPPSSPAAPPLHPRVPPAPSPRPPAPPPAPPCSPSPPPSPAPPELRLGIVRVNVAPRPPLGATLPAPASPQMAPPVAAARSADSSDKAPAAVEPQHEGSGASRLAAAGIGLAAAVLVALVLGLLAFGRNPRVREQALALLLGRAIEPETAAAEYTTAELSVVTDAHPASVAAETSPGGPTNDARRAAPMATTKGGYARTAAAELD